MLTFHIWVCVMHTNNKLSAGIKVQHELLFLNGVASWLYDALPSKCLHLLCIKAAAPTNCRPTEIFEMITALYHRPGLHTMYCKIICGHKVGSGCIWSQFTVCITCACVFVVKPRQKVEKGQRNYKIKEICSSEWKRLWPPQIIWTVLT